MFSSHARVVRILPDTVPLVHAAEQLSQNTDQHAIALVETKRLEPCTLCDDVREILPGVKKNELMPISFAL